MTLDDARVGLSTYLIRLGSGTAGHRGAGSAATALDRFAAAGLRVPAGVVLLGEAYDAVGPAMRADAAGLGQLLGQVLAGGGRTALVTVRPAAAMGPELGPTGGLVSITDPAALGAAVLAAWTGWERGSAPAARDVVLSVAVEAVHAGVVSVRAGGAANLATAWEVTPAARNAAARAGGAYSGRELALPARGPRLTPLRRPDGVPLPPWGMRLAGLLRAIRRRLGPSPAGLEAGGEVGWEVGWADDGRRCRPTACRPSPAPGPIVP